MKKFLIPVIIILFFTSLQGKGSLVSVTADEFEAYIKKYGTEQLLDVRTPQEYDLGHIPGAKLVNIYDSDFKQKIAALNFSKSKPVLIYCRSGNRSLVAGRYLAEQGFQVINLKYGIKDWVLKNKPVDKK